MLIDRVRIRKVVLDLIGALRWKLTTPCEPTIRWR
jgi:hypothetical protein